MDGAADDDAGSRCRSCALARASRRSVCSDSRALCDLTRALLLGPLTVLSPSTVATSAIFEVVRCRGNVSLNDRSEVDIVKVRNAQRNFSAG